MIYIVLGMHKSGTTVLAKTLHQSGILMVEDSKENISYDEGNQFERESTKNINKQILNCLGQSSLCASWNNAPGKVQEVYKPMEEAIDKCQNQSIHWGFKDPRTCLTYSIWKKVLPPHKLVMIYRNPCQVIKHYSKLVFRPIQIYNALKIWEEYNEAIINIYQQSDVPCLLVDFEDFMSDGTSRTYLKEFLNVEVRDARDEKQFRHRTARGNYYSFLNMVHLTKSEKLFQRLKLLSKEDKQNAEKSFY